MTAHHDLQRVRIPEPAGLVPYPEWTPPFAQFAPGERIQILPFHDQAGNVVERWHFSDSDVRYYQVEKFVESWVAVKVEGKAPVSQ